MSVMSIMLCLFSCFGFHAPEVEPEVDYHDPVIFMEQFDDAALNEALKRFEESIDHKFGSGFYKDLSEGNVEVVD